MDGLKIKENTFSNVKSATDYFRLEADYFTAPQLSCKNIASASKYITRVQYGTSDFLNEEKEGYPVLRLNEFDSYFIKEPEKYCNLLTEQQFEELKLHKGDILVCRTNGNPDLVGRAAVVMEEFNYAFASYLFRVNVNDKITPETLVAFLQSKYGRIEIDKNSMKGNQTNFSPAKLQDVKIPSFSKDFCLSISALFNNSYLAMQEAKSKYALANSQLNVLLNHIHLDTHTNYSIKTLSSSLKYSGRLDSEFYQSNYDLLEEGIKQVPHKRLKNIADVETGEFIEESLYGDSGISYVRGTDIVDKTIKFDTAVKVNVNKENFKLLRKKDIAFSLIGSVGNVSINEETDAIVSNNLGTVSVHDKDDANYVLLFLASKMGQMLFEKYQTRTAQPKINKKDVENFLIPMIEKSQREILSSKVQESFNLRKESKRLLDVAIKAVEVAIETDENTALLWIKTQV